MSWPDWDSTINVSHFSASAKKSQNSKLSIALYNKTVVYFEWIQVIWLQSGVTVLPRILKFSIRKTWLVYLCVSMERSQ